MFSSVADTCKSTKICNSHVNHNHQRNAVHFKTQTSLSLSYWVPVSYLTYVVNPPGLLVTTLELSCSYGCQFYLAVEMTTVGRGAKGSPMPFQLANPVGYVDDLREMPSKALFIALWVTLNWWTKHLRFISWMSIIHATIPAVCVISYLLC